MATVLTERHFDWPTDAEITRELRTDMARLAQQYGTKSIRQMDAELAQEKQMQEEAKITRMARGLSLRDAPHSAAAARAKREAARAATPAAQRKERIAKQKAERAERKKVLDLGTAAITILKKDFAFGKEGSGRNRAWQACLKSKTVGEYLKNGGAKKYLTRWEAAGAIKLGEAK